MITYLLLALCITLLLKYLKPISYWIDKNVVEVQLWPILGISAEAIFGTKSPQEIFLGIFQKYRNERYVGLYQFGTPVLFVRDLNLIKQITVKDADHFMDRNALINLSKEPFLANSMVFQPGKQWRHTRTVLSPSFTGSKMKTMFGLVTECAETYTTYFHNKTMNKMAFEMKDIFCRFTNDMIATCLFGVTCDSMRNRDNEFYMLGKQISNRLLLKFFFMSNFPFISKFLNVRIFSSYLLDYFENVIKQTIQLRREKSIHRPDMVHLLLRSNKSELYDEKESNSESKKESVKEEEIASHAFIFFLGGFDTISTAISFTVYELAINESIQERLYKEIKETLEANDGTLTYDILMQMEYLDMVISESLRKWPPMDQILRSCSAKYTFPTEHDNETPLTIDKGVAIIISAFALHRCPEYFPNPETFDPDRFSPENRNKITPGSYLPFGSGQRNCIGSRFSIMVIKLILVKMLEKFVFKVIDKTQIPLKLNKRSFFTTAEKGIWLGLQRREILYK